MWRPFSYPRRSFKIKTNEQWDISKDFTFSPTSNLWSTINISWIFPIVLGVTESIGFPVQLQVSTWTCFVPTVQRTNSKAIINLINQDHQSAHNRVENCQFIGQRTNLSSHHCFGSAFPEHRPLSATNYKYREFIQLLKNSWEWLTGTNWQRSCQTFKRICLLRTRSPDCALGIAVPSTVHIPVSQITCVSKIVNVIKNKKTT